MLAYHQPLRRQHYNHLSPIDLSSPSPSQLGFFDTVPHTTATPSPSELANEKFLRSYFSNPGQNFNNLANSSQLSESAVQSLLMNTGFDQNPAIRVQQSTPVPQLPTGYTPSSAMYNSSVNNANTWNMYGNMDTMGGSNTLQTPDKTISHRRAGSASSMGSDFSSASHGNASAKVATASFNADQAALPFANHLPTPSQTPTHDTFLSQLNQYSSQGMEATPAMFAMKEALMDRDDEVPPFSHSSRHSVSSFGRNSPATPRGDDYEEKRRANDIPQSAQKFDETTYQAASYPTSTPRMQTQQQAAANSMLLSPYHPSVNERLRAANDARSQSPSNSSRGVSPFRNGSPLNPVQNSFGSPQRIGTASRLRESQQSVPNSAMKAYAHQADPEPKTISPKDALLDYNETEEDSKMPLFSESEASAFNQQFNNDSAFDQQGNWSSSQGTTSSVAGFNFMPSAISTDIPQIQFPQFPAQQYRSAPARHEPTPDFPAHLTSMESTASEAPSESNYGGEITRPAQTNAGRGTYSCTYHGCPERFESPQKLQKHKREGHRQNVTSTPVISSGIGSSMSSAELMKRNSQAGPHKCNRVNPTTGKPCNTEFSRPYDLTRHEDTIHNNRKQKVRCALCTEEKTFSRNDALTRHMRVVHPEVDFPGKHRRRGSSD